VIGSIRRGSLSMETPVDERALWQAERRRARLATWCLRLGTLCGAGAYLYVMIGLRRVDLFYLLLNLFAVFSGLSQFIVIERFRIPDFLTRAAFGGPLDEAAARSLWAELVHEHGFAITALTRRRYSIEETRALPFDEAVAIVRAAERAPWPRIARVWIGVYVATAALLVVSMWRYVPNT
jgi:hypothetical protein